MHFANPSYLWLFLVFIPLIAWYIYKQRRDNPTLSLSSLDAFVRIAPSWRVYMRHILFVLRLGVIGCLIFMLARPLLPDYLRETRIQSSVEGTDIVIALDVSPSMLARDFTPDRIEKAKSVATEFIKGRPNDNIGLVVFGGESKTALPLTNDRDALATYIASLNTDMMPDGTAIGDGIGTAINTITSGPAKSKSIILLTDGVNNTGLITPRDAGLLAKEKNIKIYAIGIGKRGKADFPAYDQFGRKVFTPVEVIIDEDILRDIATETQGKYFRATDDRVLENVFSEIDQLEKSQISVEHFTHTEDDPGIWPGLALFLFLSELVLRYTLFRKNP